MSKNLYWRPAPKDPEETYGLGIELKMILARRFWNHDGSSKGDKIEMNQAMLPYLMGLDDAGVQDAAELGEAIKKHRTVEIWIDE